MLELCRRSDSDCLVAPCCNGKMHQHFLEEELAKAEPHTLEGELDLEDETGPQADQQVPELDRNKNKNLEGNNGREEEEECLNFYPRSKLFSSLLSRYIEYGYYVEFDKTFCISNHRQQYWALSRAADDDNHYPAKCLVIKILQISSYDFCLVTLG